MKVRVSYTRKARIEILPLIDIVFLLLVFFIYAMLSMVVHRSMPVQLPRSETAAVDKQLAVSVTVRKDGTIFLDNAAISLSDLADRLNRLPDKRRDMGVLLFADRTIAYQRLFQVLDEIRNACLTRISLQAEMNRAP